MRCSALSSCFGCHAGQCRSKSIRQTSHPTNAAELSKHHPIKSLATATFGCDRVGNSIERSEKESATWRMSEAVPKTATVYNRASEAIRLSCVFFAGRRLQHRCFLESFSETW